MNTKKVLGLTQKEFEKFQIDVFLQWANLYAGGDDKKAQLFMIDKLISKWFSIEFYKRLNEFEILVKPYLNGVFTPKDRIILLVNIMETIFDIYPSALLTKELIEDETNSYTN